MKITVVNFTYGLLERTVVKLGTIGSHAPYIGEVEVGIGALFAKVSGSDLCRRRPVFACVFQKIVVAVMEERGSCVIAYNGVAVRHFPFVECAVSVGIGLRITEDSTVVVFLLRG